MSVTAFLKSHLGFGRISFSAFIRIGSDSEERSGQPLNLNEAIVAMAAMDQTAGQMPAICQDNAQRP